MAFLQLTDKKDKNNEIFKIWHTTTTNEVPHSHMTWPSKIVDRLI